MVLQTDPGGSVAGARPRAVALTLGVGMLEVCSQIRGRPQALCVLVLRGVRVQVRHTTALTWHTG